MTALSRIVALTLMFGFGFAMPALAAPCVNPGDILEMPTPGYLKPGHPNAEAPNLFMDTDFGTVPVTVVSVTTSRLRVLIPATALYGTHFQIRHRTSYGADKTVKNSQTCDQSGGGGDGGSGGDGGNGDQGQRDLSQFQNAPLQRATKNDVAAPSGAPEVVLIGSVRAVAKAETVVMAAGGSILRTRLLTNMGLKLTAVDIGGVMTLDELRAELARNAASVTADRHSVYRGADGSRAYAGPMVGFDPASPCRLSRPVRVGIIDGPIDATNPALQGVSMRSYSALNDDDLTGSTDHATGIASLIAGNGKTDLPAGLAQGAEIYSVIAFAKSGGRDVARLENIAAALDWMLGARVQVVNMSLAGPPNDALQEIIGKADAAGMVIVAAAGNGGQKVLAYPASDDHVIGITAIDATRKLYRKANTGNGLDFAAPGVDVMVAGRSGIGFRSGTSYAAAIATGIIAQETARGRSGRAAIVSALRKGAEDLGDTGPDTRFGYGLIRLNGC